jgi:hypothetical protein
MDQAMGNVVTIAMQSAEALYGATGETQWYVTFVTNDVKRGKIVALEGDVFALVAERWVYFFDEAQVVHISPHLRRN